MAQEFTTATNAIAHEEYPGDQCYTCGWEGDYDVFIQARQHGGCKEVDDRPCVVSEYGDWEYYAQNAGLAQDSWQDLTPEERNSRQDRTSGEQGVLQQAFNFQEAHNDNLNTSAFADGLWGMFDYNRGYSTDLETSGCMDIFRIPKPSYYFFKSQRSLHVGNVDSDTGAMVYIANRWTAESPLSVRVYSNCEEVALYLNKVLVARQLPDKNRVSTNLAHPPFTFIVKSFVPGRLRAEGIHNGVKLVEHEVRTPGSPVQLEVTADLSGRAARSANNDVVFVHSRLTDNHGVDVMDSSKEIAFSLHGDGELIGENPVHSRSGIATILFRTGSSAGLVRVVASAKEIRSGETTINVLAPESQNEGHFEPR